MHKIGKHNKSKSFLKTFKIWFKSNTLNKLHARMYLSLTNRPIKIIDEREYYIMKNFEEAKKRNFKRLEQFVPVVARVHGEHHPEFHDVHKIFDEINAKVKKAESEKPELENEFKQLREITDNYTVPGDVCESYEAVYNMLSEVDKAYHA